jgi:hypothetical protein
LIDVHALSVNVQRYPSIKMPESVANVKALHQFEPHPDPERLTAHGDKRVDYEPHPDKSLEISPEHQAIVKAITA